MCSERSDLFHTQDEGALSDNEEVQITSSSSSWEGPYCPPNRKAYRSKLAYLCMRILLDTQSQPISLQRDSYARRDIAALLAVPELGNSKLSDEAIRAALQTRHASGLLYAPQGAMPEAEDCALKRNFEWIVTTAQLSTTEARVFEMAMLIRAFPTIGSLLNGDEARSAGDHYYFLASLIQQDPVEVKNALRRDSILMRCALVNFWNHGLTNFASFLKAPQGLTDNMEHHTGDPEMLLRSFILPLQSAFLKLEDFAYMRQNNQLASAWLSGCLESARLHRKGGHLLVCGAPGLGKTEWVRALLRTNEVHAMELAVFADSGVALNGLERLRNLRMSMHFMRNTSRGVLVFDEADDVFGGRYRDDASEDHTQVVRNHRASLNHTLENAHLPVIWIMNEAGVLDPAVLRRFDAVIHFEPMPRTFKHALLREYFAGEAEEGVSDKELQAWSNLEGLTPALIASLSRLWVRAREAGQAMDTEVMWEWIQHRVRERGSPVLRRKRSDDIPWSSSMVNASMDPANLTAGIRNHPQARVLLYGLPGTGKTAYAKALAQELQKPLLERRASDLLSAFVGETEAHIAAAFDQAEREDAVLFLDEADSLLASRESATKSWEVSQVNELLVQLHDFQGVVVLATNWLDHLDGALMRRMDAKVEFLPLNNEQTKTLLTYLLAEVGVEKNAIASWIQDLPVKRLRGLYPLTPGDFATERRRIRFAPLTSNNDLDRVEELIGLLEEEVRYKSRGAHPMGFVHLNAGRDVNATPRSIHP